MKKLRIGMIGLDTSHALIFTKLLNDTSAPFHVPGGTVIMAYAGGSPDFPLSIERVEGYTHELKQRYGVKIVDSIEEVSENCDAILLESVDGRIHLEQFKLIAPYGKPVFIDKPLALNTADAREIIRVAEQFAIPLMSSSSLRYADALLSELEREGTDDIIGADAYGPMEIQPTQSHYFWYGIHSAEMLYAILGQGCEQVSAISTVDQELLTGVWRDGRVGTIRGNRCGNTSFGALVHRRSGSSHVAVDSASRPYYASLLEQNMKLFHTEVPHLALTQTLELIRFLEAAEESRTLGGVAVKLALD